ncbi:MAG: phage major capsid protein [Clostridiales bacterium]|jgi:hypothetical protein|nr:phage major capsid protein [Clostridiales bacterium]
MSTVTLSNAEQALKSVYLGVVSDQLNANTNPLYAKIEKTTEDVWGKDVRKTAPIGINGGFSAGTETGNLPQANGNRYVQFVSTLKNLYGQIEISDKAVRASSNSAGAMVNLLNAELEGLLKASKFNLARMLFGDGSGKLAQLDKTTVASNPVNSAYYDGKLKDNKLYNLIEGMTVDFASGSSGNIIGNARIHSINRQTGVITFTNMCALTTDPVLYVQDSKDNEITGLESIFNPAAATLYGLNKAEHSWLNPTVQALGEADLECKMQEMIDQCVELYNSDIDMIVCSAGVKRAYMKHMSAYKRSIDVMNVEGGYKAMSFNGIPLVSDRFCAPGKMYFLNTRDFKLHQLCDWKWLEGDNGRILKQIAGKAVYSATLVKYAELICDKPCGQAALTGITEQ